MRNGLDFYRRQLGLRLRLSIIMAAVPLHTDEAVVENGLWAAYGPGGLVWGRKLDQCTLWVVPVGHL